MTYQKYPSFFPSIQIFTANCRHAIPSFNNSVKVYWSSIRRFYIHNRHFDYVSKQKLNKIRVSKAIQGNSKLKYFTTSLTKISSNNLNLYEKNRKFCEKNKEQKIFLILWNKNKYKQVSKVVLFYVLLSLREIRM